MEQKNTGLLIRALRLERNMTQKALADRLCVTEQAVSKWERGLGCPDVHLLLLLSQELGVPLDGLLSGSLDIQTPNGGNMRQIKFYVCPQCGNLITSTGTPALSCCGRMLEPLVPQKPDDAHQLSLTPVEDEWYITAPHPMEKDHFLSFAAWVNGDQLILIKRWPEWDYQVRIPRKKGFLFWHCTKHGLFRQTI